jgi:pimeloyl-ACP methyl ester carboxylesterase
VDDYYLTLGNCKIRYRDTGGNGPVVLLTHGIGASLETWEEMLALVDENIRWISWDIPGHGLSDFDERYSNPTSFAQMGWMLLDALSVERAVLVGNSLGGAISIHMTGEQPDRVIKLGLLNAATLGKETVMPFRLMTLPVLGEIMARPGRMRIEQQINGIFYHSDTISDRTRKIITRNVMQPGASKAFLTVLRNITTLSGQRQKLVERSLGILSNTQLPVLFIHGRQDALLPLKHSEQAHQRTRHSSLLILEECGHTSQLEQPQAVATALQELVLGRY